MKNLQNWWQISTIQIGGVICLPVIIIGQTLSQTYGFSSAVISIILGNAVLLVLGLITAKMSFANRKTTMQNAEEYFGGQGIAIFAFIMMISLVGWFGIQLNMMSLGVLDLFSIKESKDTWLLILNLGLGSLITYVALNGINAVTALANLSLPFLLLTLGYAVYTVEPDNMNQTPHDYSIGGSSLVIALAIACVIDLPTYYRHARSTKDGYISIVLIFAFVLPLLEVIGVYLSLGIAEGNILDVLKRENGFLWNIWIAIFLILAGWTTNNVNLYSSAMCMQSIFKNITEKKASFIVGAAGTLLSCLNLLQHLAFVLDVVGVFIASMGAVVLTRYLIACYFGQLMSSGDYTRNLLAWLFGIAVGFLSIMGYSFTTIALIDAVLAGSLGAILTLSRNEHYEKAF